MRPTTLLAFLGVGPGAAGARTALALSLALSLALLPACIAYEPIPSTEVASRLQPGDRVLVTTSAGEELSLKVVEIDAAGASLLGEDRRVPIAEIVRLERRKVAWGRTAAAVGGGTLILLAAFSLAVLALFAAP